MLLTLTVTFQLAVSPATPVHTFRLVDADRRVKRRHLSRQRPRRRQPHHLIRRPDDRARRERRVELELGTDTGRLRHLASRAAHRSMWPEPRSRRRRRRRRSRRGPGSVGGVGALPAHEGEDCGIHHPSSLLLHRPTASDPPRPPGRRRELLLVTLLHLFRSPRPPIAEVDVDVLRIRDGASTAVSYLPRSSLFAAASLARASGTLARHPLRSPTSPKDSCRAGSRTASATMTSPARVTASAATTSRRRWATVAFASGRAHDRREACPGRRR